MATLRIELAGEVVPARLPDGPVRIGRDATCEIRLDVDGISAIHATVEPFPDGGHKLVDANSGRPTKVNGLGAKRVRLNDGDVVEIGPARITYAVSDAVPAAAPRPPVPRAAAPVVPARVAPRAVEPAATPAPAPAPAAASSAVLADAAVAPVAAKAPPVEAALAGSAPAPTTARVSPSKPSSAARVTRLLVALGAFAVVAFAASRLLSTGGESGPTLEGLRQELRVASDEADEGDLDKALADFDRLGASSVAGIAADAHRQADYWRRRAASADQEADALIERAPRMEPTQAVASVAALLEKYGPLLRRRRPDLREKVEAARGTFVETRRAEVEKEAEALVADGRFSAAVASWDAFAEGSGDREDARRIADEGRAAVASRAADAFAKVAAAAAGVAQQEGPSKAAILLRSRLVDFAGTPSAAAIAERANAYDREAFTATTGATAAKGPAAPREAGTPPPAATAPAPSGDAARVAALVSEGEGKAASRRFADAAKAFADAVAVAGASPEAARVKVRAADLGLARDGLDLLVRTIHEHADRFEGVEVVPGLRASIRDADAEWVTSAVHGGTTKQRWTSVDGKRVAALVEAAGLSGKDSLPFAGLLREVGAREPAEKVLFRFVQDGGDKDAAYAVLARWRGEAVPAGGYVAYEGRLVSTTDRDRLVFEARVAAAAAKVASKDAAQRKAAYAELLSLGAPAREAAEKALRARREAAVKEVAASKTFTSGRVKQRLLQELEKRREAALALIEDPARYPYPSAAHEGQAEVDRLVAAVREVWDHPFALVVSWEKSLAAEMAVVGEVDEVLGKVVDGYAPDLEAVQAAVDKAIDVPGIAPDDYSAKVLAWNAKTATTADAEERDDVLAVNEYRIMMGRAAVRINERLVRASRGHSIEMRVLDYFEHNGPTPGLETPAKRAASQGYGGGVGENIAYGSGGLTGRTAFDGWFHSSGHHRNMVNKAWTEMGVGRSLGGLKWTQMFGALGGKSLADAEALPPPTKDVAPEPDPSATGTPGGDAPGAPNPPGKSSSGGG